MSTLCYSPVRGRVARFTSLNECGQPVPGTSRVVTTAGIVKVDIEPTYDNVTAQTLSTEDSDVTRVRLPEKTSLIGFNLSLSLVGVDPDLVSVLTGNPVAVNAQGDHVGYDAITDAPLASYSLEVWTRLAGRSDLYGYTVFPRVRGGRVKSFAVKNAAMNLEISGSRTSRMPRWSGRLTGEGWDMTGWDTGGWDTPSSPEDVTTPGLAWRTSVRDSAPTPSQGAVPLAPLPV